jgi:hypothetical protein
LFQLDLDGVGVDAGQINFVDVFLFGVDAIDAGPPGGDVLGDSGGVGLGVANESHGFSQSSWNYQLLTS